MAIRAMDEWSPSEYGPIIITIQGPVGAPMKCTTAFYTDVSKRLRIKAEMAKARKCQ